MVRVDAGAGQHQRKQRLTRVPHDTGVIGVGDPGEQMLIECSNSIENTAERGCPIYFLGDERRSEREKHEAVGREVKSDDARHVGVAEHDRVGRRARIGLSITPGARPLGDRRVVGDDR